MTTEEMIHKYGITGHYIFDTASGLKYTLDEITHPSQDPAIAELQRMVAKLYADKFYHDRTYKDMLGIAILNYRHQYGADAVSNMFIAVEVELLDGTGVSFHIKMSAPSVPSIGDVIVNPDCVEDFGKHYVKPTVRRIIQRFSKEFPSDAIKRMSVIVSQKD